LGKIHKQNNIMNIPENLKFTKDHEWVKVDGGIAIVGITDFAQSELGDIVFVEIETEDEELEREEVFGTIEAVKTVSDLYMPVSGKIIGVNEELENHPEMVNKEPYEGGWMVKIEMADPDQVDDLLTAAQYKDLIE
jgi:glycine cleavage system H protein